MNNSFHSNPQLVYCWFVITHTNWLYVILEYLLLDIINTLSECFLVAPKFTFWMACFHINSKNIIYVVPALLFDSNNQFQVKSSYYPPPSSKSVLIIIISKPYLDIWHLSRGVGKESSLFWIPYSFFIEHSLGWFIERSEENNPSPIIWCTSSPVCWC